MEHSLEVHRDALSGSARPARAVNWWIVAPLIWAVPATIATLQQAAVYATRGALQREWVFAAAQFPRYMLWAPLTALIVGVARRYPIRGPRLARSIVLHLGLAVLCIILVEGISTQLLVLADAAVNDSSGSERLPLLAMTLTSILARGLTGLVTYAAIVGVATAFDSQARLRDQAVRSARLQRDLADAQVQSIKMQVQPHFLFNTLHAVNVLIDTEPIAATRMVTRLGDLLRHTLSRPAVTEVPLRTELDVLQLYLEIEQTRFRDRLTVRIDATAETLDALVPDLILQPLAENAIRHGIESDTRAGSIEVQTARCGASLVIEVRDSGSGPGADVTDRIGLTTVRGRLARLYADAHEFSLAGGPNGGCVARICIPFRTADG